MGKNLKITLLGLAAVVLSYCTPKVVTFEDVRAGRSSQNQHLEYISRSVPSLSSAISGKKVYGLFSLDDSRFKRGIINVYENAGIPMDPSYFDDIKIAVEKTKVAFVTPPFPYSVPGGFREIFPTKQPVPIGVSNFAYFGSMISSDDDFLCALEKEVKLASDVSVGISGMSKKNIGTALRLRSMYKAFECVIRKDVDASYPVYSEIIARYVMAYMDLEDALISSPEERHAIQRELDLVSQIPVMRENGWIKIIPDPNINPKGRAYRFPESVF